MNLVNAFVAARYLAGLVAGTNLGSLTNCRVSGSITGRSGIGGLVGVNGPDAVMYSKPDIPEYPGLIYRCHAAVAVLLLTQG